MAAALRCLPATAAAAEAALLEPVMARKLLLTAAVRQHTAAVQRMVGLPAMQQHVDAATIEAVCAQLVGPDGGIDLDGEWGPHHDVLLQLYQLPAAAGISSEAVLQQLQAWAGSSSFPEVAEPLCAIPAVAQISSEAVVALLSIALEHHLSESLNEMLHRLLPVVHEQLGSQQGWRSCWKQQWSMTMTPSA